MGEVFFIGWVSSNVVHRFSWRIGLLNHDIYVSSDSRNPLRMTYFTEYYVQMNMKEGLEAAVFIFHIKSK